MPTKDRDEPYSVLATPSETDGKKFVDLSDKGRADHGIDQQTGGSEAVSMDETRLTIEDNSAQFFSEVAAKHGVEVSALDANYSMELYAIEVRRLREEFALLGIRVAPEGHFERLRSRSDSILQEINAKRYPAVTP